MDIVLLVESTDWNQTVGTDPPIGPKDLETKATHPAHVNGGYY